ncbi:hypothetical protein V6B16_10805 [Salinimicrobium catena]|uniref:hypothetical protein n=1 Tax=Salinimicrobium catena TaxID=390640 RepID=UPI002FE4B3F4
MLNHLKRLIDLVEQGDAGSIHADKCLEEIYSELKKYGMIMESEGRIFFTDKGNEARLKGLQIGIEQLKLEEEMIDLSEKKGRLGSTFFFISLFLFLVTLTLFLMMNFTTYSLWG